MSEGPPKTYTDREIDGFHGEILMRLERIEQQTVATNGKVRKIVIALVLGFGLILGLGVQNASELISIFV